MGGGGEESWARLEGRGREGREGLLLNWRVRFRGEEGGVKDWMVPGNSQPSDSF